MTTGKYDDIINLPHKQSSRRPHMSMIDRAAQFSPFAALTGHDAAIKETARLTDRKIELDEYRKVELNAQLQQILEHVAERPRVIVTYFLPDKYKEGGAYVTHSGAVKKIDEYEQIILMSDGTRIPIEDVAEIEGSV